MKDRVAIVLLLAVSVLAGCSPVELPMTGFAAGTGRCGIDAYLFGPAQDREFPPACALPAADDVAFSCSIRDALATPGFPIPDYDEAGELISGTPYPQYLAEGLACEFTDDRRNRAQCTFRLIKPDEPARSIPYRATMEYSVGLIPSDIIHGYRESWRSDGQCLAEG